MSNDMTQPIKTCQEHSAFAKRLEETYDNTCQIIAALNGRIGQPGGIVSEVHEHERRIVAIEDSMKSEYEVRSNRIWDVAMRILPWGGAVCMGALAYWVKK